MATPTLSTLSVSSALSLDRQLAELVFQVRAVDIQRLRRSGLDLAEAERRLSTLAVELALPRPTPRAAARVAPVVAEVMREDPTPAATPIPQNLSEPPVPIPAAEPPLTTSFSAAEWAVDDNDILETDDSIGPGGLSIEPEAEIDLDSSVEATISPSFTPAPLASVGDLDAATAESTIDRDLKAFFADESVDGSVSETFFARTDDAPSIPADGPRGRRETSLLSNVKKLFKK